MRWLAFPGKDLTLKFSVLGDEAVVVALNKDGRAILDADVAQRLEASGFVLKQKLWVAEVSSLQYRDVANAFGDVVEEEINAIDVFVDVSGLGGTLVAHNTSVNQTHQEQEIEVTSEEQEYGTGTGRGSDEPGSIAPGRHSAPSRDGSKATSPVGRASVGVDSLGEETAGRVQDPSRPTQPDEKYSGASYGGDAQGNGVPETTVQPGGGEATGGEFRGGTGRSTRSEGGSDRPDADAIRQESVDGGLTDPGATSSSDSAEEGPEQTLPEENIPTQAEQNLEDYWLYPDDFDERMRGKSRAHVNGKIIKLLDDTHSVLPMDEREELAGYSGMGAVPVSSVSRQFEESNVSGITQRTINAVTSTQYFTPIRIAKAVWGALESSGFKGGKVLDLGCGSGRFVGCMPKALRAKSEVLGIDLDPISIAAARGIHPEADFRCARLEDTFLIDGHFDLVVGNVPFSDSISYDKELSENMLVHDYFLAKALKKVREGGVVALITSRGTMNKVSSKSREYISGKLGGHFLGSAPIPGVFEENWDTEVLTDLIFFQKNPAMAAENKQWCSSVMDVVGVETKGENFAVVKTLEIYSEANGESNTLSEEGVINVPFPINKAQIDLYEEYGLKPKFKGINRFRKPIIDFIHEEDANKSAIDQGLDRIHALSDRLPVTLFAELPRERYVTEKDGAIAASELKADEDDKDPQATHIVMATRPKVGSYLYDEDTKSIGQVSMIYKEEDGYTATVSPVVFKKDKDFDITVRLIEIRDHVLEMLDVQGRLAVNLSEEEDAIIEEGIIKLNNLYDDFVKDFNCISYPSIARLIAPDVDSTILLSLENYDVEKKTAEKSGIFYERHLNKELPLPESAESLLESVFISLAETGRIEPEAVARRLGVSFEAALNDDPGVIFLNPEKTSWELGATYLKGNVVEKLKLAREAAKYSKQYEANIPALEGVVPEPLKADQISFSFGASWIPESVYPTARKTSPFRAGMNSARGAASLTASLVSVAAQCIA